MKLKSDAKSLDKEDLEAIIKQKPNRKILGFLRFHLGVYNMYKKDKKAKIKETVGEPPVVYDSILTDKSVLQLQRFMRQRGYYKSDVTAEVKRKKRKVKVRYNVVANNPMMVDSITYKIDDRRIRNLMLGHKHLGKLEPGMRFDFDALEEERTRITRLLKNNGYLEFAKQYIRYEADTTGRKGNAHVYVVDKPFKFRPEDKDTVIEKDHIWYYIHDVHVYINCDKNNFTESEEREGFFFHYIGRPKVKTKTLARKIFLHPGELFRLQKYDDTYHRMGELGVFKSVNIRLEKSTAGDNLVDVYIDLTNSKSKSIVAEAQGTNNLGNLGIFVNTGVQFRNAFRGAENVAIKFRGGVQAQPPVFTEGDTTQSGEKVPFFNTYELGPELELNLHRFLLPIREERFARNLAPQTKFKILYNFQERVDYSRNLLKTSMSYSWNENQYKRHVISPVALSLISLNPEPSFQAFLDTTTDAYIFNSYKDHLIAASSYSFIFKNNTPNKLKNFSYFRFNFEGAGNLLRSIDLMRGSPKDVATQHFELFNIRYAQYVMGDIDFRHYFLFRSSSFATRVYVGYAVPFGNLDVMPFQRAYFAGGANEMRAWQARTLGPGTVKETDISSSIDQIGDTRFETNLEYRFDITKIIELGLFIDAGNIWLRSDPARPEARFAFGNLWRDMAIGGGVGLRLDFNFFIIRLDLANRMKDPGSGNPLNFGILTDHPPNLNLGIGYPF